MIFWLTRTSSDPNLASLVTESYLCFPQRSHTLTLALRLKVNSVHLVLSSCRVMRLPLRHLSPRNSAIVALKDPMTVVPDCLVPFLLPNPWAPFLALLRAMIPFPASARLLLPSSLTSGSRLTSIFFDEVKRHDILLFNLLLQGPRRKIKNRD